MTTGWTGKLPIVLALIAAFAVAVAAGCSSSTNEPAADGARTPATSEGAAGGGHGHADGGQIALTMAAIDVADTAGVHGMQEELENGGEINERWASKVGDTLAAIRAVPWDESLVDGVDAMVAALERFEAGLTAGDAEAALEGAVAVHEAQHHFSPAAYAWLSEQSAAHDDSSTLVTGLAAIDIIDSAGFHGMGDAIAEAGEISGRNQRTVTNALAVLDAASWPEDAKGGEEALAAALEETAAKMEAGDVDGALEGLHAIHEAQHDLSHGFYAWLAANHDSIDHSDPNVARACTLKSVDMVNNVGLHGMAEDLDTATAINDRYAGQIDKMVAIFAGASQHGDAAAASEHMGNQLVSLQTALEAGDIESAREAAHAAHDAQHDLSHDTFAWLAGNPAHSEDGEAHESEGESHEEEGAHGHGEATGAEELASLEPDRRIQVTMETISYAPNTITVKAGEVVELTVDNTVDFLHDLTIDEMDADVYLGEAQGHDHGAMGGGADDAALHVGLESQGASTVRFRAHEPGEYGFYCTVPGHREAGMTGTLVVTE